MKKSHRLSDFLPGGGYRIVVLLVIAGLVALAVFTPAEPNSQAFDPRLSTTLNGPNGAKGLHDLSRRLGWKTEQRMEKSFQGLGPGTIVTELLPPVSLSERETSILLGRIRNGASLFVVVEDKSVLADSLGLDIASTFVSDPTPMPRELHCPSSEPRSAFQITAYPAFRHFARSMKLPPDTRTFGGSGDSNAQKAAVTAIGFPFGRGRVVALSDSRLLRNDFIRVCRWGMGISVVRMLEYLSHGRPPDNTLIVFDEFHQGLGSQPSVNRATINFLFYTAPGFMIVQVIVASLILLLAIAPRPIPPAPVARVQRRSQFEHVEALSSAYRQIAATRTVARTLVGGLRRRVHGSVSNRTTRSVSDEKFLTQVASAFPGVASEVKALSSALSNPQSPTELAGTVAAIETIERTIKR